MEKILEDEVFSLFWLFNIVLFHVFRLFSMLSNRSMYVRSMK